MFNKYFNIFIIVVLLNSCNTNKVQNVNSHTVEKVSIFYNLFSDILQNPYDYENIYNVRMEIDEEFRNNVYQFYVENEWFRINYRPEYFAAPFSVFIFKKNDKIIVC